MKLKSLLLGSAAAMIAVSGARAADAVVAEPEPMEYVKVCDMYGAGFFYIPGTETCLAFSGYVRTDFSYNSNVGPDTMAWAYRARVNIDARNETDWGTLRSQIRFQSDGNGDSRVTDSDDADFTRIGGDGFVGIDRALISIAGIRLGYSDSFTTTFHGYGLPIEKNDGFYGYDQAIFLDYTYTANGFSIGAGIQNSTGTTVRGDLDYYVGASYAGSWGNVAATYIYENDINEGAYKISATVTAVENLTLRAFWAADGNGGPATRQVQSTGDYAWGVGARYQIMDNLNVSATWGDRDQVNGRQIAVGLQWDPVPGLSIRPEAAFNENDTEQYTIRVYRTW